ncbi:MAG: hypothetical protein J5I93_18490, partial [Pirellulaceae bacterium]|nr:hypothetical protein [Pirellulaceae bacterium]
MRLTLRTMLAYLDDILEPADAEQLGQKIEESKFAGNLVHRIRKCTRRVQLGTPPVIGRGLGGDANSVAEYLDNTLAQDRVPEFEKICLESDVHLAEVASCHQILTMVLGEPREVPAEVKRRMYGLNRPQNMPSHDSRDPNNGRTEAGNPRRRRAEEQAAAEKNSAAGKKSVSRGKTPEPAAAVQDTTERTLEVPDYLRSATPPKSRLVPVLATLVATFLVALVALLAMGPINRQHPVLRLLMGPGQATEVVGTDGASPPPLAGELPGEVAGEGATPEGAGGTDTAATEDGASGTDAVAKAAADGPDGAAADVPR